MYRARTSTREHSPRRAKLHEECHQHDPPASAAQMSSHRPRPATPSHPVLGRGFAHTKQRHHGSHEDAADVLRPPGLCIRGDLRRPCALRTTTLRPFPAAHPVQNDASWTSLALGMLPPHPDTNCAYRSDFSGDVARENDIFSDIDTILCYYNDLQVHTTSPNALRRAAPR